MKLKRKEWKPILIYYKNMQYKNSLIRVMHFFLFWYFFFGYYVCIYRAEDTKEGIFVRLYVIQYFVHT